MPGQRLGQANNDRRLPQSFQLIVHLQIDRGSLVVEYAGCHCHSNDFFFLFVSVLKFALLTTGVPLCSSMSRRVRPATAPPSLASFFSGSKPCESLSRCSLVVVASASMVRISSMSVI